MSDGNTVPLTHPAPPVSAPYPVPDTSTTQVITPADLPQHAVGPFAVPADGATVTLSAPALSDAPTFATTVPPVPPTDAPTFVTGAQPITPPAPPAPAVPADGPTFTTGAQPITSPAAPAPAVPADGPTFTTGAQPITPPAAPAPAVPADGPTFTTGAQPITSPAAPAPAVPADGPTFTTGAQPITPPAPPAPAAPADGPTFTTGAQPITPPAAPAPAAPAPAVPDQSATQVIKPETLAAAGGPTFSTAAQADLQKATTALDAVDKGEVKLDLDKQAVQDLIKLITQARDVVDNVHRTALDNLDVELKFGNNWVGEAISRRLREVAVGDDASAVSVIGDFLKVLFEVEKTIRDAARNLENADDEAAGAFGKAAGEVKGS
ncbi:hypothetical protein ACQPW3_01015 [Actinosynnema sp. CA-248983]